MKNLKLVKQDITKKKVLIHCRSLSNIQLRKNVEAYDEAFFK